MRWRLIISYALIITVALGTVLLVINLTAENQVKGYLKRGALAGVDTLVEDLEDYYQPTTSWEGVAAVIEAAHVSETAAIDQAAKGNAFGKATQSSPQGNPGSLGLGEGPGMGPGGGKTRAIMGKVNHLNPHLNHHLWLFPRRLLRLPQNKLSCQLKQKLRWKSQPVNLQA